MFLPSRRFVLLTSFASLTSSGLAALALPAWAASEEVQCQKIFPFLEQYLELPAGERSHFRLSYVLKTGSAPRDQIGMVLRHRGVDTPIRITYDNSLAPQPPLAALKAKSPITVTKPDGVKLSLNLFVAVAVPLSADMDASPLKQAVSQAHKGAKRAAGLMAVAVPNLDRVAFVGATSGTVELSDGRKIALPIVPKATKGERVEAGSPYFTPADHPTAARIHLDKAPIRGHIMGKAK